MLVECSVARRPGCENKMGLRTKFNEPATQPTLPPLYGTSWWSALLLALKYNCQLSRGDQSMRAVSVRRGYGSDAAT